MRLTDPATSGWIVDERRERSVAMNSDARSTGLACRVIAVTPAGGNAGAPPAGAAPPFPHAESITTAAAAIRAVWVLVELGMTEAGWHSVK
jgi:hypothetical protein